MYTKKAELKVGILVLVALAILLGLLFFAGGEYKPWGSYARWNLRFAQGRVEIAENLRIATRPR